MHQFWIHAVDINEKMICGILFWRLICRVVQKIMTILDNCSPTGKTCQSPFANFSGYNLREDTDTVTHSLPLVPVDAKISCSSC